MKRAIELLFLAPPYPEIETALRARLLNIVFVITVVASTLIAILNLQQGATTLSQYLLIFSLYLILATILNCMGKYEYAAYSFTAFLGFVIMFNLYDGAALHDPGVASFPIYIFLIGFLLGKAGILISLGTALISIVGLHFGHQLGWFELNSIPTLNRVLALVIIYSATGAMTWGILWTYERILSELQTSEDRFKGLFYSSSVPIVITNTGEESPKMLLVNNEFEKLTGYSKAELEGRSAVDLGLWNKKDRDLVASKMESTGSVRGHVLRWKDKAGNKRIASLFIEFINFWGVPKWIMSVIDITDKEETLTQLRRQLLELQSISEISNAALQAKSADEIIETVTKVMGTSFYPDHFGAFLLDSDNRTLTAHRSYVGLTEIDRTMTVTIDEGILGEVARTLKSRRINDTRKEQKYIAPWSGNFFSEICVPIHIDGNVIGVLNAESKKIDAFSEADERLLSIVAIQTAIAINNVSTLLDLEKLNTDLSTAYDSALMGWSRAMDLRDHETEGHTQRVTEMTINLAKRIGIAVEELDNIRRGSLLHDIGKIGVPDNILLKAGPMNEKEWEVMKAHPQLAFDMLKEIPFLRNALDIPYFHHERWDGSGYPKQLVGEKIPLAARIFSVVDVYDALVFDRPYRRAWSKKKAIEYIVENSGILFDPGIVQEFTKMLSLK